MSTEKPIRIIGCVVILAALIAGLYLRITDPTSRTFWGDEAWRVQQIFHASSYDTLLEGEYYGMEMPVQLGEYILGKVGISLFRKSEWSFRVWSQAASILTLLLFTVISLRFMSYGTTALLLTLLALSSGFIEHTYEFKPYSIETLLVLLLLFIDTTPKLKEERQDQLLAITFALCCLFSNTWIFFPFIPLLLLFKMKERRTTTNLITVFSGLIGAFGIYRFLSFQALVKERGVTKFWSPYTLDSVEKAITSFTGTVPYTLNWYCYSPFRALGVSPQIIYLAFAALFFIGVATLLRKKIALYILTPLTIFLILGIMGEYPFFMRVSAFYYPILLLSVGAGIEAFHWKKLPLSKYSKPIIQFGVMALSLYFLYGANFTHHSGLLKREQNIKPFVMEFKNRGDNESVALNYQARLAIAYYLPEMIFKEQFLPLDTPKSPKPEETCEIVNLILESSPRAYLLALDRVAGYEQTKTCCINDNQCRVFFDEKQRTAYMIGIEKESS